MPGRVIDLAVARAKRDAKAVAEARASIDAADPERWTIDELRDRIAAKSWALYNGGRLRLAYEAPSAYRDPTAWANELLAGELEVKELRDLCRLYCRRLLSDEHVSESDTGKRDSEHG